MASSSAYGELQKRVEQEGLFQKSSGFYIRKFVMVLLLLGVSLGALVYWSGSFWVQILNAAFLAFVFGQFGFLMHDIGHRQFGTSFARQLHIGFNVLLGWCMAWWIQKHDRHHDWPNTPGYDPDLKIGFLAFSEEQAGEKRGLYRFTARYQHLLFIPLLFAEIWHLRYACIAYSLKQRTREARVDLLLMGAHLGAYVGILFFLLPPLHALAFILLHSGGTGVYIGSWFAQNHKGMQLIEHDAVLDKWKRQVLTARNVRGGRFTDPLIRFFSGGLNHQIEHHLFPELSPDKYWQLAKIVKAYCQENDVPYCVVSLGGSIRAVFTHLFRMRCTTASPVS